MSEAIQKILKESELNDTIALQEATNSVNTKEKQRMSNTSGPYLLEQPQQIQVNSSVSDKIKGQDDKLNAPVILTTTPSQTPGVNERIASTGARTLLNFPSRLDINTPAFVLQDIEQSATRTESEQ